MLDAYAIAPNPNPIKNAPRAKESLSGHLDIEIFKGTSIIIIRTVFTIESRPNKEGENFRSLTTKMGIAPIC